MTIAPVFGAGSRIRINQLGYLPEATKKAVFISESDTKLQVFTIHDALTNELCATLQTVQPWGSFDKFNSNYTIDFSSFKQEGAFYIKAGDTYSPTIYINQNLFINTTDKLIEYIHSQRFGDDVSGGWWYDASNKNRSAVVNAAVTYQLLYTYNQHTEVFSDLVDFYGKKQPNGIPDIIDEAKWGLDWLSKVNYKSESPVVTGKLAAAFALASDVLKNLFPELSTTYATKEVEIYQFARQNVNPITSNNREDILTEENWKDDMQLAATHLYFINYNNEYLQDAMDFGAAEPVPQWIFSNCDKPLQFYPYLNWSPFMLMQVENPFIKKNYQQNMHIALLRAKLTAQENPFNIGISLSENSNNKITALHNLCFTYRKQTGDTTFVNMEEALFNWIFGCNPWGISMVTDLPENGLTPQHPHSKTYIESDNILSGALVNGAISNLCLKGTDAEGQVYDGPFERYQTEWAIYRDHVNDFITNQSNIDATTSLLHLLALRQANGEKKEYFDKNQYDRGGINRFNPDNKQVTIIFTGHQYADGYKKIKSTLNRHKVKASFFFSGDFMRKAGNARKIKKLKDDGHYIGPATNHYQQLADWNGIPSSNMRKTSFLNDLKENYAALKKLGISKQQAPFFNPPFELYNDSISKWCKDAGIYLVRSTPGTYSNLDYTFPEMRENYYSTKEIMDRIMQVERSNGLNGYILQFHFGTNPGRKDKLYNSLSTIIGSLKNAGYQFTDLYSATNLISEPKPEQHVQKKNKSKK
jgi:peptidoglycan/xylan/chitin deacetylase (PgdA/CDA1 family)